MPLPYASTRTYSCSAVGFARIGGYSGLESKFLDAQPNITRDYYQSLNQGENVTEYQMRYAKCGKKVEDDFVSLLFFISGFPPDAYILLPLLGNIENVECSYYMC